MSSRVVLDTKIVVSAILSPFGAPAGILSSVFAGNLKFLYDDRIIIEYEQVLARKKFNFSEAMVNQILDYLVTTGERVCAVPLKIKLKDPFDLPFIEVAVSGLADVLITGNKKHFPQKLISTRIVAPQEFLQGL